MRRPASTGPRTTFDQQQLGASRYALACGGFDEQFPAKEDYELGLRLWKMAYGLSTCATPWPMSTL